MPTLYPRRTVLRSLLALAGLNPFPLPSLAAQLDRNSNSLATFADKIEWDVAKRGPLLLVAPHKLAPMPSFVDTGKPAPEPPRLNAGEFYPASSVAEYCEARVVEIDSLSAIVPATMTVLNWRNLPPPDFSQGIALENLPAVLLMSLTPLQWEKLSQDGIDGANLTESQKDLWDQIFAPDSLASKFNSPPSKLKYNDLRKSRLRLVRSLSYAIVMESNPGSTSSSDQNPESTPENPVYSLQYERELSLPVKLQDAIVFGATLLRRLPNRTKLSDLSYDATGLSPRVSLSGLKTVDDILKAVQQSTGIQFSSDIRYAELPVIVRGDSGTARARDLLKLLALSVTGTLRKLTLPDGKTFYHLPDDLTRLGVRHTAIRNWINQASVYLKLQETAIAENLFASKASVRADWYSNKQYAPSPLLKEKIESQTDVKQLLVAVDELPEKVREKVDEHWVNNENDRLSRLKSPEAGRYPPQRYRKDVAQIKSRLNLVIETPDGGTIFLKESLLGWNTGYQERQLTQQRAVEYWQNPKQTLPVRISAALARERGIDVVAESPADAAEWARIVAQHGLTHLFLTANGDMPVSKISEQVQAAKAAAPSIHIHIRFHALRVTPSKDKPAPGVDRNILGETFSERNRRYLRQVEFILGKKSDYSRDLITNILEELERTRQASRSGDFLSPGFPSVAEQVVLAVQNIKKECGTSLGGLVLIDLEPPGYESFHISYSGNSDTGDETLGYLPTLRSVFCQKYEVDPIDMSSSGDKLLMAVHDYVKHYSFMLPYFPDYGGPSSYTISGEGDSRQMGAKDRPAKWQKVRNQAVDSLRSTLVDSFKGEKTEFELLIEMQLSQGKGYVLATERQLAEKEVAIHPEQAFNLLAYRKWVRQINRFRYNDYGESKRDGARASQRWARQFASLLPQYVTGVKTDAKPGTGFVLDFTEVKTPGEGAELLKDFVITP